jgi:hypothetical protein
MVHGTPKDGKKALVEAGDSVHAAKAWRKGGPFPTKARWRWWWAGGIGSGGGGPVEHAAGLGTNLPFLF